jgi:hypothetical protein
MDIQHLVDRLEDLIDEGRHMPLSKYTLIDEERALEIIDQMRISVPEQIEKATRIVHQRDRLIAQANEESSRMLEIARQKSEELVNRDAIVQKANYRAENIVAQSKTEAEAIRAEADGYVVDVLRELESHLLRTLTIVRNGINKVLQDRDTRNTQLQQQAQTQPVQPPQTLSQPAVQKPVEKPSEVNVEERQLVDVENQE